VTSLPQQLAVLLLRHALAALLDDRAHAGSFAVDGPYGFRVPTPARSSGFRARTHPVRHAPERESSRTSEHATRTASQFTWAVCASAAGRGLPARGPDQPASK
jgi:hypothetical protein